MPGKQHGKRTLFRPDELWPIERRICQEVASGTLVDAHRVEARLADIPRPADAANGMIRAAFLVQLLTGLGPNLVENVSAVRLKNCRILGRINLGGMDIRCPLELNTCTLGVLILSKSQAMSINLRGSHVKRISARELQIKGSLNMSGDFRCDSGITLLAARVGGSILADNCSLSGGGRLAMNADRIDVHGSFLVANCKIEGGVSVTDAKIGHHLVIGGSEIDSVVNAALNADRLVTGGNVALQECRINGCVRIPNGRVGSQFKMDGSWLRSGMGEPAFVGDGLTVGADAVLCGLSAEGEVRFSGARVGGQFTCDRVTVKQRPKIHGCDVAFTGDGLEVGRELFMRHATIHGEMRMVGGKIQGEIVLDNSRLTNKHGPALRADTLSAGDKLSLIDIRARGEVRLPYANISGPLILWGAKLRANSFYVDRDGAQILDNEIIKRLPSGTVGESHALFASRLTVGGSALLDDLRVIGNIDLSRARVSGSLTFRKSRLRNHQRTAVDLERASVGHETEMRPRKVEGTLNLAYLHTAAWYDEKKTWPKSPDSINLDGLTYDSISAPDASVNDRLEYWIGCGPYRPQPYEQLRRIYLRQGDTAGARAVSVCKEKVRRQDSNNWSRYPRAAWSSILRWTIGYGYRPAFVLLPWLVLLLAGSIAFRGAYPGAIHAAKSGPEQPAFSAIRYTADLLFPVANFKQRDSFIAVDWAAWLSFGYVFAGWLLAAILVAGLSGVFKRD